MKPLSISEIQSVDNPKLKRIRKLCSDNLGYRKMGQVWLEGDHLCGAYLAKGLPRAESDEHDSLFQVQDSLTNASVQLFFSQGYEQHFEKWWRPFEPRWSSKVQLYRVPDAIMKTLSSLESPTPMGMLVPLASLVPARQVDSTMAATTPNTKTIVLDRLQDPGNVGSIVRSAAALGFRRIVALKGTAALWGAKVLRAGMGAHFALELLEGVEVEEVLHLGLPLVVTSSHRGHYLHESRLPREAIWVFGHEGQGVDPRIEAASRFQIRIAQPGGEESLNVAAAAAICLYSHAIQAYSA